MSHAAHEQLPGYDPGNVWHDGCPECEQRAAAGLTGVSALDDESLHRSWAAMLAVKWSGEMRREVSVCDQQLIHTLYQVDVIYGRVARMRAGEKLRSLR